MLSSINVDQAIVRGLARTRFHIPPKSDGGLCHYLLGNSLGLQPKTTQEYVLAELEKWKTLAAAAHFQGDDPWMPYHELLSGPLAEIVGALPDEVVAMNSLTVNLHLLLATFYRPRGNRRKILMEANPFPSDYQAIVTSLQNYGQNPDETLVQVDSTEPSGITSTLAICDKINAHRDELALIVLPGVHFVTGQLFDIPQITACARAVDIPIGWDLAHAIGNVPLSLHDWQVDFAVWCSYKYLNAGPGAVAGVFIHHDHSRDKSLPRLGGWWGHDKQSRFQMKAVFDPIPTAEGWQLSNPPILAMAPLRASLAEFKRAGGMGPIRECSLKLVACAERMLLDRLGEKIEMITPHDPSQRGSQLSLRIRGSDRRPAGVEACEIVKSLEQRGILADYRFPDVIRVAFAPLYNHLDDALAFVEGLEASLQEVYESA